MKLHLRLSTAPWLALVLVLAIPSAALAGNFKHITIDGSFGDWGGVAVTSTDVAGDSLNGFDLRELYVANDEANLYFLVKIYPSSTNSSLGSSYYHLFLDTDANPATGLNWAIPGVGSELCLEFGDGWGSAFSQTNGDWSNGNCTGVNFASAPSGVLPSYAFEFRLSRSTLMPDGVAAFRQAAINLGFATVKTDWSGQADYIPAGSYEMAPAPPPFTGTRSILGLTTSSWQVNDTGTDLGTDWLAPGYDDFAWNPGAGLFGFNAPAGVYPASIATAMTSGRSSYYLRTHFEWTNDTAGVGFEVSNYLSAGAVFYVNGVEADRLRMPSGTVGYSTPATAVNPQPGKAEIFYLPAEALVVGDNVFEVEVHPAAGVTDSLVFGLSVTASDSLPPSIVDPTQPEDRNVLEGQPTTFSPGTLTGTTPFSFQWFKGADAIPGETNRTLTIASVVQTNAGSYSVRISNPRGATVTSRAAVLTTTAVPVSLTDLSLPANQTVVEGTPATFTVAVQGTLPTYQWYEGANPIANAVGPQLTLDNVLFTDSGKTYSVGVSNRLGGVLSRAATLTVEHDVIRPSIESITGGGKSIIIAFSEPLNPASAEAAASYTVSGGVGVLAAALAPNGTTVTLTTTPMAFGQQYTLSAPGVKDRFGNTGGGSAGFKTTIIIDGSFEDWTGVPVAASDLEGDSLSGFDLRDISVAHDDANFYFLVRIYPSSTVTDFNAGPYHLFVDADANPLTGNTWVFGGQGTEICLEFGPGWGGPFQQKNGGWDEGVCSGGNFAEAPTGVLPSYQFEFRLSRSVQYPDSTPVFATNSVTFGMQSLSPSWSAQDSIVPFTYTVPTVLKAARVGSKLQLTWEGGGELETRDSLATGTWTTVTGAVSGVLIETTNTAAYYRVKQ